jgi:hypothetical protein
MDQQRMWCREEEWNNIHESSKMGPKKFFGGQQTYDDLTLDSKNKARPRLMTLLRNLRSRYPPSLVLR